MTLRRARVLIAILVLATVAACGPSTEDSTSDTSKKETLTVFAAASLRSTFTEIGEEFEKQNEGTTVTFNFAGSSDLVAQINQGAPADVFASADTANMDKAVDDDSLLDAPVNFATNALQIVTPPGNPAKIKDFADLADPKIKLVVCAPQVPCGSATTKVAKNADVRLSPVSEEQSVTGVLGKVVSGDADAGLVYVTDATGAGDKVTSIAFPESSAVVNMYPIAVAKSSKHAELAKTFVDRVAGAEGQKVLGDAGFGQP